MFSAVISFTFLVIKSLDPEPDPYPDPNSLEMLDPGPDSMNPLHNTEYKNAHCKS
jgi:hypothetical protein